MYLDPCVSINCKYKIIKNIRLDLLTDSKQKDLHKTSEFLCFYAKIVRIAPEIATVNVIFFFASS